MPDRIKTERPSKILRWDIPAYAGLELFSLNDVPASAQLLNVGPSNRGGLMAIWFILDTAKPEDEERVTRRFQVFGTGHDIPAGFRYCGTVQDRTMVWHLFELEEPA